MNPWICGLRETGFWGRVVFYHMSRRALVAMVLWLLSLAFLADAASWTQTSPLPDGYSDHALVYGSGFLYQTGGSSNTRGPADGTNVFFAKLGTGGTVGTWKATTSLPAATVDHAGVAANGYVYVIGGEQYSAVNGEVVTNAVYYAKTNSDGSLGAWLTANPLPNPAYLLSASVWSNTIYVAGGTDNENFYSNVYSATIQSNGSLSAWTSQTSLPVAVVGQAQAANGVLYVLGGSIDEDSIVSATVYYAKINADGSLAGWSQTTALPQGVTGLGAVAANGDVYSVGGWDPATGATNGFYTAAVLGGGPLNPWTAGTPLPVAVYAMGTASTGSNIFVSGGISTNNASSSVFSMALPSPPVAPSLTAQGLSTNGSFQLKLTSTTNTGFGMLASTNLTSWTNIGSGFTDATGSLVFQDTNAAGFGQRFYRAYWPLP
jgi:hypothetical protein